jgi:hypothetical protein
LETAQYIGSAPQANIAPTSADTRPDGERYFKAFGTDAVSALNRLRKYLKTEGTPWRVIQLVSTDGQKISPRAAQQYYVVDVDAGGSEVRLICEMR